VPLEAWAADVACRGLEGRAVVCDLTQECTHGRRVGSCDRDGRDIAAELICAGLARCGWSR
jgi:endonuclease YncB( thermonuclease family)